MFDIGFSELAVIGVVALIVIGPERLPGVARTVGHLLGRLRRYVGDVKADISREMELADLKRMTDEVQQAAQNLEQSFHEHARSLDASVRALPANVPDETHRHDEFGVAAMVEESNPAQQTLLPPEPGAVTIAPEAEAGPPPADENQLDMFAPPPDKT